MDDGRLTTTTSSSSSSGSVSGTQRIGGLSFLVDLLFLFLGPMAMEKLC